jgi:hypothetical protein
MRLETYGQPAPCKPEDAVGKYEYLSFRLGHSFMDEEKGKRGEEKEEEEKKETTKKKKKKKKKCYLADTMSFFADLIGTHNADRSTCNLHTILMENTEDNVSGNDASTDEIKLSP